MAAPLPFDPAPTQRDASGRLTKIPLLRTSEPSAESFAQRVRQMQDEEPTFDLSPDAPPVPTAPAPAIAFTRADLLRALALSEALGRPRLRR
jgi:hypothetical protein